MAPNSKTKPNLLITGTPGTGKTTMSSALAEATYLRHLNISEVVKEKNLHDGWDEEFECHVINEDLVCDERWFDRVVVLQTDNTVLYDRLHKRGYKGSKLSNNIECEIFQVSLEEAKSCYSDEVVVAMKSDNIDDISGNIATLTDWVTNWHPQ